MSKLPKTIFITVKLLIISIMMVAGIRAHMTKKNREPKIIALLALHLVLLGLIFVYELMYEYLPIIYIILVCTGASSVFQTQLHIESAKAMIPEGTLQRNKCVIGVFYLVYLLLGVIAFLPGVGARCGQVQMSGFNGRTYPFCFAALLWTNLAFWGYTVYLYFKAYGIDDDMLKAQAI